MPKCFGLKFAPPPSVSLARLAPKFPCAGHDMQELLAPPKIMSVDIHASAILFLTLLMNEAELFRQALARVSSARAKSRSREGAASQDSTARSLVCTPAPFQQLLLLSPCLLQYALLSSERARVIGAPEESGRGCGAGGAPASFLPCYLRNASSSARACVVDTPL